MNNTIDWFNCNKLSINYSQKYMILNSSGKGKHVSIPPLTLDGKLIEKTDVVKFLGVELDSNLTWKHHILSVEKYPVPLV